MVNADDIRQAREILGQESAGMDDAEVAELVAALDVIAGLVIDAFLEQRRQSTGGSVEKKAA